MSVPMPNSRGATYGLTRDDGAQLRVSGDAWESSLELAFLYGWRPVGTEAPRTAAWRRSAESGGPAWDHNYFTHESQHVTATDARALAEAVFRALRAVPDAASGVGPSATKKGSPLPSRATASAAGLSLVRRRRIRGLALFAERGGFTIGA